MAHGLLKRILEHIKDEQWATEGSLIVDPFGGIGTTGIMGAYSGLRVVCVELEQKFVDLAEQNFKLHDNAWAKLGNSRPVIVQGDSRRLCSVVKEYLTTEPGCDCIVRNDRESGNPPQEQRPLRPPLGESGSSLQFLPLEHNEKEMVGNEKGRATDTKKQCTDRVEPEVSLIISSPPYEGTQVIASGVQRNESGWQAGGDLTVGKSKHYGQTEGQLGEQQGPTFWAAAQQIVQQCYQILRPGGHAVWVVKDFVRAKKRVDFTGDWRRLCESAGFETLHEHHAMLVKESRKPSLFGHEIVKTTSKKSFFRRLCESKGSPAIDWETVLCMRKQALFT